VKLLLDEMYPSRLAMELRRRGHDVVATQERPDQRETDDEPLLLIATSERRALVTENVADFPDIVTSLTEEQRSHSGVLLVSSRTFPRTEDGLGLLVRALDAYLTERPGDDELRDRMEWLIRPT